MGNKIIQLSDGTDNLYAADTLMTVVTPPFSSLPQTFICEKMTEKHTLVIDGAATLSNPSAQVGDWTLVTSDGYFTIYGSISEETTAKFVVYVPSNDVVTATIASEDNENE